MSYENYRSDIDGLRGIAVIAVILNHFFGNLLPSGFLGVDVFFVISGYVITSYLSKTTEENWKDYLLNFYSRRVKRLLPALLACVMVTNILFLLLAPSPSREIFKTGYFALIGFSNIFLLNGAQDYFSLDAKLNPFTQTWSLGVEEQFYLIFPVILALLGYSGKIVSRSFGGRAYILVGVTAASLLAYFFMNMVSPTAAFYLMPTRFWELSAGALAFIWVDEKKRIISRHALLSFFILSSIFVVFFSPPKFQIFSTILVVVLTAGLLCLNQKNSVAYKVLTSKMLLFVGTISYSLYLWHWSVLVLGRWTIGEQSALVLLFISVVLAIFSYYVIEKPLRYKAWVNSRPIVPIMVGAISITLVVLTSVYSVRTYLANYNTVLASFYNIPQVDSWADDLDCHGSTQIKKYAAPYVHCLDASRTITKPHVFYLIGDSHAAQLVFMANKALKDLPYSVRFINSEDLSDFPQVFMRQSNARAATLDFILKNAKTSDVVAISFHRGHLNDLRDQQIPLNESVKDNEKTETFYSNSERYFGVLGKHGVKVLLIRDTPLMSAIVASPSCLLQIKIFEKSVCGVTKEQDLHTRYRQDYLYSKLESNLRNVYTWDPSQFIYEKNDRIDVVDSRGEYVMMDWHHITRYESEKLAKDFLLFFRNFVQEDYHPLKNDSLPKS